MWSKRGVEVWRLSSQVASASTDTPPPPPPSYREARRVKRVRVATCGPLFDAWRRQKKRWPLPRGHLAFDVEYLDTGGGDSKPLVVALHGAPGSYEDYEDVFRRLHGHGIRMVAPLFPECETVKLGRFRHSPEEKAEYVRDFLQAVGISRVDLLLCHSGVTYTGLKLCLDQKERLPIASLCLLNPSGFVPSRVMKPWWLLKAIAKLYEFPVGYQVAEALAKSFVGRKPHLKGDYKGHLLSIFTMTNADLHQRKVEFEQLLRRTPCFPVMLAFSGNDRLIDPKIAHEMARMVSHESHFQKFDDEGRSSPGERGVADPRRQVLLFENGTHFLFKKHPQVLSEKIASFLFANLRPSRSS